MIQRVLVVDDYHPWRRHVCSTLHESSGWQIVGEATDGPDAIKQALELRPDLILLDVGLPTLNGIEVARRILAHDPHFRILFVSEHQSCDIAEAALCTGARGYICKSDAGRELSKAMDAVVDGRRFVGARLGGRVSEKSSERTSLSTRRHEAAVYSDNALLVDDWARLAEAALDAEATFIVVAGDVIRDKLHETLQVRGVNLDRAIKDGRYVSLNALETLSKFMVDDAVDEERFWAAATSLMLCSANASTAPQPHVVACGECAPTLCKQGKVEAAIRLEHLWDELGRTYHLDIFCGYTASHACCNDGQEAFERLRAAHTATDAR